MKINFKKFKSYLFAIILCIIWFCSLLKILYQPQFKYVGVNLWDVKPCAMNILIDVTTNELWLEDPESGAKQKWLDENGNVKKWNTNK